MLNKVLAILMVAMASALALTHTTQLGTLGLSTPVQAVAGVVAGSGSGWSPQS